MIINKIKQFFAISISISTVLGILFLGNYIVQAIQTGGAGHDGGVIKDAKERSLSGYDVTVCSSGCDYTSIYTAFNSNSSTPSTYYIAKGTYNETNTIVVPNTSTIYYEQVVIDFNTNSAYLNANPVYNTTMSGDLTIKGDGSAGGALHFYIGGSDNNYRNLTTDMILESAGTGSIIPVIISGSDNDVGHIIMKNVSGLTTTGPVVLIYPAGATYTKGKFTIYNVSIDTTNTMSAMRFQGSSHYNVFEVLIENTTNTGSGNSYGVLIDSGNDYNSIFGISKNAKTSNLTDGGAGNKTGQLVI